MQYTRILQPPIRSFFLFGARGTGKSTWLRQHFSKALWINLLDEQLYQSLLADVGLFARMLQGASPKSWVVVDEVQRLPHLLNEVHRFIEEHQLKFALSGSSARKLRRAGVNLLAGRASKRLMLPFLPEELGNDFDLDQQLQTGSIPLVVNAEDQSEALQSYVQMYLKEEIQAEALVRNLPGFARFLPIAALAHSQILNVANIAREAEVARATINGFLEILEDTMMTFLLQPFEAKLRLRERKHPKLYWIDPGLVRALKKSIMGHVGQEELGHLFEGWIAVLLYSYLTYQKSFDEWAYWSPTESNTTEVDFVLRKGEAFTLIEVKASTKVRPDFFKGLRACQLPAKALRRLVVYRGAIRQTTDDGIEVVPVAEFLKMLANDLLF